jgi:hypothetical protein
LQGSEIALVCYPLENCASSLYNIETGRRYLVSYFKALCSVAWELEMQDALKDRKVLGQFNSTKSWMSHCTVLYDSKIIHSPTQEEL